MNKRLELDIRERERDGVIGHRDLVELANEHGIKMSEVEIASLQLNIIPERYLRNSSSINPQEQIVLLKSTVCVIGLGGLGCFVCEELARVGIGRIIICDFDLYDPRNLNRQIYCDEYTLNMEKVEVTRRRIKDVNPSIEVISHNTKFSLNKRDEILQYAEVIVDCTDNSETRLSLMGACKDMGRVLVYGSIAGWFGQVTVIYPEDEDARKILGDAMKKSGVESKVGNLAFTAGVVSSIQVSETIKVLLKKGTILRNKILFIDLLNSEFTLFDLKK